MTSKQFTPDLKLKAVNYYHKIKNYVKVCEIFECSERSLKRWVERYNKNKNVNRKTRKLGSYKLEKQHIQSAFKIRVALNYCLII